MKFVLMPSNDQKRKLRWLMFRLKDLYCFIRQQIVEEVIVESSDIDYYFDKFTSEDQGIPKELLYNCAKRAWGHAQASDHWNEWDGFCIVLSQDDSYFRQKFIEFIWLEDFNVSSRVPVSATPIVEEDRWLIIKSDKDYLTGQLEKKQDVQRQQVSKWVWGRMFESVDLEYQLKWWPKVHNSFVRRVKNVQVEFPVQSENQIVSLFSIWYENCSPRLKRRLKRFPFEMFAYMVWNVSRNTEQGNIAKYLSHNIKTVYMLCGDGQERCSWKEMFNPLTGNKPKWRAKRINTRYVKETVNRPHVLKLQKYSKRGNEVLAFAVKPVAGLSIGTGSKGLFE